MNISGTTAIAVERDALIKEVERLRAEKCKLQGDVEEERENVATLEAQCAAMRSALEDLLNKACCVDGQNITGIKVDWMKDRIKAALALDAGKGFVPADAISDEELGEFQNEVRDLVIELSGAPSDLIDGKGSDAGWQEFTLAEIAQGFAYLKDNTVPADKARVIALALLNANQCRCPGHWKSHAESCPIGNGLITAREIGVLSKNPS